MRRRVLLIAFSCVLLVLCAAGVDWAKTRGSAPTPVPSVPGGYYEDAFVLYLDAPPFGQIYYTTDGSEPSVDSLRYENGIPLTNRSSEPNLYHSVQNVVKDWKTNIPDPNPVEKGTVIRAVYVNNWGTRSEILTQTYFVGITPPEQGCTLSLVFSYDDLFGEDGIYVTGRDYDAWYLSGGSGEAPVPNFETHMEVAVVAELLDSTGDVMNQQVGLRIQGASARAMWNKRFIITAREKYSGSSVFDAALYDGVATHSVMIKEALPDAIAADLSADRAVSTQRSIPVRVFLNGEFWYNTYMLERYDNQYFRQHYHVDDRILVKNGTVAERPDQVAEQYVYEDFMKRVKNTDYTDPANWAAFQEETDVQSYIDYIVINYYLCNVDFCDTQNYVLWRGPSQTDRGTGSSRWRWCIYDIDVLEWLDREKLGMPEAINVFTSEKTFNIHNGTIFRSIKRNPEFCQQFVLSFMDMLNNNFAPANVEKVLEKYGYTLDWVDGYFRKRPAYAVEHLAEEFGLTGSLETVAVYTANPEMGDVIVNTSQIDLTSGSWSGQYFTDYPITVTATARDGYQFLGWKGDADTAENALNLSVDGGITLEAVFAKEK